MTLWPPQRNTLKRPAYRSLAHALTEAIEAGEIRPGDRLPTHRELAYSLGLSVQTIGRAYEELTRLGIISGEVGRGTFVRAGPADTPTPWQRLGIREEVVDCSMMTPVTDALQAERMRATMSELADDLPPDVLFSFRPRASLQRHRECAVGWLERCGLATRPDLVLPTNGNTAAMTVALMTAANPGDLVVTEELGHHTVTPLARYLGLRLAGLSVDEQGLLPDAFARVAAAGKVRVLYVMPNGVNPLAFTMGPERRRALCEIARRHDIWILENDAGGPVQPSRPPPMAALAPERTFYFTGLSKCLVPGLRVGFLVVPETMMSAASARHLVTNWMATALVAEIAARWIEDGTAAELLDWQKAALARRNGLAAQAFRGLDRAASPNGLHVWLPLPRAWDEAAFVSHARHNGVAVASGAAFSVTDPPSHRGIRVCLGAASEAELSRGLQTIARLVRSRPEPALLAV